MKPLMQLPLLLCDRNDFFIMYRTACTRSGVDVAPKEFIHKAQIQSACFIFYFPSNQFIF